MRSDGVTFVYELKVPLPYDQIGIGFERGNLKDPIGRGRGGGGFGGGRGAGGRGAGGGLGGGPGGDDRPDRPDPLKLWARVQLSPS